MKKIRSDPRQLRKQLYKLILAEFSMYRVRDFARQLLEQNAQRPNLAYKAFITAICVEYGRPFAAGAKGSLGNVSSNFEKFTDSTLKDTHDILRTARNDLYAHYSTEHQRVLLELVSKERDGKSGFEARVGRADNHVAPIRLALVKRLAIFQAERFRAEGQKICLSVLEGQALSPGEYQLDTSGDMTLVPYPLSNEMIEWID